MRRCRVKTRAGFEAHPWGEGSLISGATQMEGVMRRPLGVQLILAALLATAAAAQTPGTQGDPLELQKRAVARIDTVIGQFRRTGDTRLQISELLQAEAELAASNRALAARQDWSALAFGLIKQGHVHRLQAQWQQ